MNWLLLSRLLFGSFLLFWLFETRGVVNLFLLEGILSFIEDILNCDSALGEVGSLSFYFANSPIMNIIYNSLSGLKVF